jgi:hypothetical protein
MDKRGDLLTLREAETLLGVSHQKMTNLVKDGVLRTFSSPLDRRKKLVRKADVEALINTLEAAA